MNEEKGMTLLDAQVKAKTVLDPNHAAADEGASVKTAGQVKAEFKSKGARHHLTIGEMVAAAASLGVDLSGTVQERLQRAVEHVRASRMHAALGRAYALKVEG